MDHTLIDTYFNEWCLEAELAQLVGCIVLIGALRTVPKALRRGQRQVELQGEVYFEKLPLTPLSRLRFKWPDQS